MRRPLYLIVATLLFVLFALQLVVHATRTSVTIDEPTHLIAGYRYLTCGDFGINREHPPLLKIVAALPLRTMDLRDPLGPCGQNDGASQAMAFEAGGAFVLANGIDRVVIPARAAAMVFSLALAALVFAAARAMFGPVEGLIALAALAFEPTLLAHGSLITNDMALATALFATVFAIYRYKERPTIARLVFIGIAAGLALASKHSGVIVLPIVVLFLWPRVRACAIVIAIAVLLLFATYGFDPRMYFDGFRVLFAGSERAVSLFDRVYPSGRWYYFPLAFAIKASVITLVLLPFAIASRRWLLLIPPALFLGISMFAGINIGVRHILPIWPFVIVAGVGGLWAFAKQKRSARIVVATLLLFHAINTAAIAPNYIAFGNYPTHRVFKDSNVEWSQNMKIARDWLEREGVTACWFAAYGHGALSAAQQPCKLLPAFGWSAGRIANAVPEVIEGTVLVSVTALPPRGGPEYAPITSTQPIDLLGGSVLVYRGTFRVPRLAAISHATRALQLASRGDATAAQNEARRAMQLAPDDPRVRRAWAAVNAK
ncbi:MAG TPA: glycosyltransferase family 39 protein [Thermoanaerobaculia bacterium]|jgi:hypothetical protein|nr:glycosyltransferase family 39 protein [Thermoanaerobaculia bacterium]